MSNHITLVGNLTRDPELRFTTGGRANCTLGMASSRRYQVNNEWQEETSFFNLVLWGELGENAAASLTKGARVVVTGRVQIRQYEDKEGAKRTATEVIVDEIGPSLRWARAEVQRILRDQPGQTAQPTSAGASRSGTHDPVYGDEEAF